MTAAGKKAGHVGSRNDTRRDAARPDIARPDVARPDVVRPTVNDQQVPWRVVDAGLHLALRLTPRAGRNAIDGLGQGPAGPHVRARVTSIPADGAANAALEVLIADWLGLAKRLVGIVAGGKSRLKTVALTGDVSQLEALLRSKLEL